MFEGIVKGLPDIEQGQEVRGPVPEFPVLLVRLFLLVQGPDAGVLDADGRRNDEDLLQGALLQGLQQHAGYRR